MYFFSWTNVTYSRFHWIPGLGLMKRKEYLYNKIVNAQRNNECYKRNNKSQVTIKQRNNECTVTRMLVNKKSCSRTEFLFEYRVIFNTKFLFENRIIQIPRRS